VWHTSKDALLSSETEHVFTDFLAYAIRELWLDKGFRAYILARAAVKGPSFNQLDCFNSNW